MMSMNYVFRQFNLNLSSSVSLLVMLFVFLVFNHQVTAQETQKAANGHTTQPSSQLKMLFLGDQALSGKDASGELKQYMVEVLASLGYEIEVLMPQAKGEAQAWYLGGPGVDTPKLRGDVEALMESSQPDLVVIHFGSERLGDFDRKAYQDELKSLIEVVLEANPEVKIFLAEIPPSRMMDSRTKRMVGMAVRNVSRVYMRRGSIYTAGIGNNWDVEKHGQPDGVPTAEGYRKIADTFIPVIFKHLPVYWENIQVPGEMAGLDEDFEAGHLGEAQVKLSKHLMMTDGTEPMDNWAKLVSDRIIIESDRDDARMKALVSEGKYDEADRLARALSQKYASMQIGQKFKDAAGNVIEQAAEQRLMMGVDAFQKKRFATARKHFQAVLDEFPNTSSATMAQSMLSMDMPEEDEDDGEINIFGG